jgi:ABC-type Fe3+-hydroxamate transport system substrate-binding protein
VVFDVPLLTPGSAWRTRVARVLVVDCSEDTQATRVAARPGWEAVPAVRDGEIHEIKSAIILQPGPAALTDGLRALTGLIQGWDARRLRR